MVRLVLGNVMEELFLEQNVRAGVSSEKRKQILDFSDTG